MADFLLSIATKIAEYAVGPILHHAKYLCCFNNFAGNLPSVKQDLEFTRNSINVRAEEATKRLKKIEPTVEKWLKDVEEVLEEVKKLEARISEARKSYFRRRCQYSLAREIVRIKEKMTQLNQNSKFEPFSRSIELAGMQHNFSKDFVFFESTKSAYNKLLETLKDKSVHMIGLVGMGGSGKTTLAKGVGKKAEESKLIEKVIVVTVSQTPNIKSIQAQIAEKLGVTFQEESNEGRAQRLSERLKIGTTLLILDDVWQNLNFEALGIPFHQNTGCRVLLTSRERNVCNTMQCQSIVELNLLTGEEAWSLFTSYAKINDDTSNALQSVARKIVNKCKGLPIAIVTLGSTLKEKHLEVWKLTLSRLEAAKPLDVPKGLTSPHVCLKLSYDNLTNDLAKSFLLLCSIFPEDHEIDLEDLFRFGKGWFLTRTFATMEEARWEMREAVDILRDSYLLLQANDEEKVKMHDMVRDVALWIASERGQAILASTVNDPRMLVEDETIKDKRVISLWDLQHGQLPDDQLNCPSLEILLLHSQEVGFEVSNACLERVKMLKILAFITCDYSWEISLGSSPHNLSVPQSIELLRNLHTLCLRGYELGDISILERLEALEILDLRGSSFEELPNGIVALKKLKLLDLYHCRIKKNNALEVIGRCLQLEELYLCLLQSKEDFPYNVSFPRLQRYVIIQGDLRTNSFRHSVVHLLEKHRPSRALWLDGFNASAQSFMSLPIKDLFLKVEYLHLKDLEGGYKNVIPSMDPHGLNQLIVLALECCREIECLFDSTVMNRLKEVFPRNSKLCSLKELVIYDCPKLTSLFRSSIAQTLVLLEDVRIYGCRELKKVIEEGDVDDYVSSQSHTSLMLPKLRYLEIGGCDKLEYIFPISVAQGLVSLEELRVVKNREMKYVFGSEKEQQSHHHTNIHIHFLNLDTLKLYSLPNLVGIWSDYCRWHLPKLRELRCRECSRWPNIFHTVGIDSDLQQDVTAMEKDILWAVVATSNQLSDHQMFSLKIEFLDLSEVGVKGVFQFQIGEPTTNTQILPFNFDLSWLRLQNLPELNFIWKGPTNFLCLRMLREIHLSQCPKLTTIFSPTIVRSLPKLSELGIYDCEEVEQIFDSSDAQQLNCLYTCSQQVCFPQLREIEVRECNKLKCLFHNFMAGHFPSLSILEIEECSQLERVFAFEREADDDGQEGTGNDGQQVLLLQNLEYISLSSLPDFKEIHHGFKLRYNVEQTIKDCPKYSPSLYLHQEISSNTQSAADDSGSA